MGSDLGELAPDPEAVEWRGLSRAHALAEERPERGVDDGRRRTDGWG